MTIRATNPVALAALVGFALAAPLAATAQEVPLKEAKLNIEHNATANDTGYQGAIDSEGWGGLTVTGPDGVILELTPRGELATLGMTELFFETVEPENAEVPIADMLAIMPEGNYVIEGPVVDSLGGGTTSGTAWLTHVIPAGAVLMTPAEGSVVPVADLLVSWGAVTETITGEPVTIIAYELIMEKIGDPDPNMIGKPSSLSMHLRPTVTEITISAAFFEAGTEYDWEILAVEESGNQTLASGKFATE